MALDVVLLDVIAATKTAAAFADLLEPEAPQKNVEYGEGAKVGVGEGRSGTFMGFLAPPRCRQIVNYGTELITTTITTTTYYVRVVRCIIIIIFIYFLLRTS